MSTPDLRSIALILALAALPAAGTLAQQPAPQPAPPAHPATSGAVSQQPTPGLARAATPAEIAGWNIEVTPDGAGLPPGSGTVDQGERLFATTCAVCHGTEGQGVPVPGRAGYPRLVGGIGTLANDKPVKTLGSFWPYATIVFDYIRRAMPLTNPQSLSADQVYALTAFLLWKNGIIAKDTVMDAKTLAAVVMPNRDGFYSRPAPETANIAVTSTAPFAEHAKPAP